MKRRKCNNKGYSFVELVVVIAIIVILAGMSAITLHAVDNAKYKKAATTLQSEINTLRTTVMAQNPNMALKLVYLADGTDVGGGKTVEEGYYLIRGYIGSGGTFVNPQVDTVADADKALAGLDYYQYQGANYPVQVIKSTRGSVYYNGAELPAEGIIIRFNKNDGSVAESWGSFSIIKKKSTEAVKTFDLKENSGLCGTVY